MFIESHAIQLGLYFLFLLPFPASSSGMNQPRIARFISPFIAKSRIKHAEPKLKKMKNECKNKQINR